MHVVKKANDSKLDVSNFIVDFAVKWNTSYTMLERFQKLKVVVDEITCNPQLINGVSKSQESKLKKLILSNEDWNKINILLGLLKPFYACSKMLQGRSYQTLSISKAVDVILFKYFENIISNSSGVELCLGRALKDQLDNYLDFKISPEHYKASLVSLKLFRILINFTKVFF